MKLFDKKSKEVAKDSLKDLFLVDLCMFCFALVLVIICFLVAIF